MKNDPETRRRRVMRRMKATAFIKRNGVYAAAFLCLAALGGLIAVLPVGRKKAVPEAPAGNSLDERLAEASLSPAASPQQRTAKPIFSIPPTAAPTFIPDMTPAPSSAPSEITVARLSSPVDGRLMKPYSMDALIYSKTLRQWMTHSGVDIAAPKGTEVRAVEAGLVERIWDDDLMGTSVLIDHGTFKALYQGLKKEVPVSVGDPVESRTVIGCIGDTAITEISDESHLHFEILQDGSPVDPEGFVLIAKQGE
ncbi:MAG: M23 family metallopeptidase [Clostridia bacterium]|nr:M23 family metallopeptidase [Clostridia bacterium]